MRSRCLCAPSPAPAHQEDPSFTFGLGPFRFGKQVGPTGTAKSTLVKAHLKRLSSDKYQYMVLNFSAQTSAARTQEVMDASLDKRAKGVYGPARGKKGVFFVDDLNMPTPEKYLAQPPIELLRQGLDQPLEMSYMVVIANQSEQYEQYEQYAQYGLCSGVNARQGKVMRDL
eukprot:6964465-Pyramimonas_sp.AAC.1